jgi:hypothetical protein
VCVIFYRIYADEDLEHQKAVLQEQVDALQTNLASMSPGETVEKMQLEQELEEAIQAMV